MGGYYNVPPVWLVPQDVVTDGDGGLARTVRHFGRRGLRARLLAGAAAVNTRALGR